MAARLRPRDEASIGNVSLSETRDQITSGEGHHHSGGGDGKVTYLTTTTSSILLLYNSRDL